MRHRTPATAAAYVHAAHAPKNWLGLASSSWSLSWSRVLLMVLWDVAVACNSLHSPLPHRRRPRHSQTPLPLSSFHQHVGFFHSQFISLPPVLISLLICYPDPPPPRAFSRTGSSSSPRLPPSSIPSPSHSQVHAQGC